MSESNESLSRRVAEAAGWNGILAYEGTGKLFGFPDAGEDTEMQRVPDFASSLDAIAALECEAGLKGFCINRWAETLWSAELAPRIGGGFYAEADTEPRARCLAYLAWAGKEQRP